MHLTASALIACTCPASACMLPACGLPAERTSSAQCPAGLRRFFIRLLSSRGPPCSKASARLTEVLVAVRLLHRWTDTAVARASDDFYPKDPASSTPHVSACAYLSLFLSPLVQPDWDMFHRCAAPHRVCKSLPPACSACRSHLPARPAMSGGLTARPVGCCAASTRRPSCTLRHASSAAAASTCLTTPASTTLMCALACSRPPIAGAVPPAEAV